MQKELLFLDLQFFADDGSEDTPDVDETEQQEQEQQDEQGEKTGKTFSRADVAKMIAAQKKEWEEEQQSLIEEERSEAARLATLSEAQRRKELENKRLSDIEARELKVQQAELRIETQAELATAGLPEAFCDMVMAEKAETIQANIVALKQMFDDEVEKAVNRRLVQKTPKQGGTGGSLTKADIMKITDSGERQRAIAQNKHLFEV